MASQDQVSAASAGDLGQQHAAASCIFFPEVQLLSLHARTASVALTCTAALQPLCCSPCCCAACRPQAARIAAAGIRPLSLRAASLDHCRLGCGSRRPVLTDLQGWVCQDTRTRAPGRRQSAVALPSAWQLLGGCSRCCRRQQRQCRWLARWGGCGCCQQQLAALGRKQLGRACGGLCGAPVEPADAHV